jgi:hypothetical protein
LDRCLPAVCPVSRRAAPARQYGPVTAKLCDLAIWPHRHSPSKRRPAVRV